MAMRQENPKTLYSAICGVYLDDEIKALSYLKEMHWQLERHEEQFIGLYSEELLNNIRVICQDSSSDEK